jgi:beta-glucosidase/6-phospho-beta-glucosidase/beta-galactosidase
VSPPGIRPLEIITGFESTYQPAHDVDVLETTGHATRWKEDLALLRSCGVTRLRYPVRWHRIEAEPGTLDWTATDHVMGYLHDNGFRPIVDLLHHTSYPRWLTGGLGDPRFPEYYLRYLEAFATRYSWVEEYTLFNEPFTTFLLCGHEAIWPPYLRTLHGFLKLVRNVFPAVAEGSRMYRDLLPGGRHVYVDAAERHSAANRWARKFVDMVNDRRFFLLDVFLGRDIDRRRPFVRDILKVRGGDVLDMEPGHVDVLGLDYYAHTQWQWYAPARGTMHSPDPTPLAALLQEYWDRYRLPCILGETNIRGFASDRATWLKYTLEQCERARDAGVDIEAYCWFPFIDSCDWDSLLFRADGHIDPVGVFWLDGKLRRHPSSMSDAFRRAAGGEPAAALPAYELQPPVSDWLSGWMPQMAHWDWEPPPAAEVRPVHHDLREIEMRIVPRDE